MLPKRAMSLMFLLDGKYSNHIELCIKSVSFHGLFSYHLMTNYLNNQFDHRKYYDVADETPLWSAPFGLKLLDFVNYRPGISALDIGFGTGFPLTELAMRLGESSNLFGIDPCVEAFDRVNKKLDYYGIKNVTLIEGVAENIPLPDLSIDLITSNNGINNVKDRVQVFKECFRLLKQEGQFVMTLNTDLTMIEFYNSFERVLVKLGMEEVIDRMKNHISIKRPPVDLLVTELEDAGFKINQIASDQFCYRFADGSAMLNHFFIRFAFMEPWVQLLPAENVRTVFSMVEEDLNQSAISSGMTLTVPFVLIDGLKL